MLIVWFLFLLNDTVLFLLIGQMTVYINTVHEDEVYALILMTWYRDFLFCFK